MGKRALLIVDVQKGFGAHGELAVPDGEAVVPVSNYLQDFFDLVIATQDWHPPEHASFSSLGVHCLQNTAGAEFMEGLITSKFACVFRKGTKPDVDSFSPFLMNVVQNQLTLLNF